MHATLVSFCHFFAKEVAFLSVILVGKVSDKLFVKFFRIVGFRMIRILEFV